jgi:hypothetical protein
MLDAMDFVLHVILDYSKCSEVRRLSAVPVTRGWLALMLAAAWFASESNRRTPNRIGWRPTASLTDCTHSHGMRACTAWRGMEWAMRVGTGRLPAAAAVGAHRHVAVRQ